MAETIRVGVDWLSNMASSGRDLLVELDRFSALPDCSLPLPERVEGGYRHLGGRWDERRDNLIDGLRAISDGLELAVEIFVVQDQELAQALTEGD